MPIDEVDYIWHGGSLVTAIGEEGRYDYIVAAHVIEHSVDLIGFLQDCETLLKPHGRVALAVPDKRFCFDYYRPQTSVGIVVDAHLRPTTFHPPGAPLDHLAYSAEVDGQVAWGSWQTGQPKAQNADLSLGPGLIKDGDDQGEYVDTHRWVFSPASLSLLLDDLAELGYHSLVEVSSLVNNSYEFYVTPERDHDRPPLSSRTERLRRIHEESADPDNSRLRAALEASQNELAELRASTSWRTTAPLRTLSTQLQQFRARHR